MNSVLRCFILVFVLLNFGDKPLFASESITVSKSNYDTFKPDSARVANRLTLIEKISGNIFFANTNDKIKKKITVALLTVFLGPLGVHRLYLGCSPVVPAVYVFTLGGCLGILPFIDLMAIIFTDDISRFENNNKIFMWVK